MSHIVTIKTELRSLPAIEAACKRLVVGNSIERRKSLQVVWRLDR